MNLFASFIASAVLAFAPAAAPAPAIDAAQAAAAFTEAHTLCTADGGRMWGVSLCGPMMFVDPQTHQAVANMPVPGGDKDGAIYRFALPANAGIANTSVEYQGRRWVQIVWPLPDDATKRAILLMHESYHRIQPQLHLTGSGGLNQNAHLDAEQGRIWLRGEMHALRAALEAPNAAARKSALSDAVAMRLYRRSLFPGAAKEEQALEINEGLAESTGIDAGTPAGDRITSVLSDLTQGEKAASYVRQFPYATGPAYAQLLNIADPRWRKSVNDSTGLALLAAKVYGIRPITDSKAQAMIILARYGGEQILAEEHARGVKTAQRTKKYDAEFGAGPTLTIPLGTLNMTFDPRDVEPYGARGSVYHSLHVSGKWGVLEVNGGDALITRDFKAVVLPVSSAVSASAPTITGEGWTLTLARP